MRSTSGCTPRPARQTAERSYLAAAAAAGKIGCGYNRVRGAIRSGGDETGGTGCGQQAGGGETVRRYDQDHQLLLPPDLRSRLPPDHPPRLVNDLVEHGLDLANIYACYTEAPLRPVPTARKHSIRGGVLNEASSGVHSRSPITPSHHPSRPDAVQGREVARFPPVFSSPAAPGWNRSRFGFDPGFAPRGHPRRTPRRRQARPPARVLHLQHQPNLETVPPPCLMHRHVAHNPPKPPCPRGAGPGHAPTDADVPARPAGSAPRSARSRPPDRSATATGVRRPATPVRRHSDLRSARCRLHLRSASPVGVPGPSARPESQAGQALSRVHSPCRATGSSGCCKQPG
jgi:hypothetical protein